MNLRFTEALSEQFKNILRDIFKQVIEEEIKLDVIFVNLWKDFSKRLNEISDMNFFRRF